MGNVQRKAVVNSQPMDTARSNVEHNLHYDALFSSKTLEHLRLHLTAPLILKSIL